jgi:DNA-binding protein
MEENKKEAAKREKPRRNTRPTRTKATTQTAPPGQAKQANEDIVFVGKKPVMNYVLACVTSFNRPESKKITLKARGRAIPRAVDTIELLRRAFMKDLQLQGVSIYTEEVTREQGRKSNVSAIEITLTKP